MIIQKRSQKLCDLSLCHLIGRWQKLCDLSLSLIGWEEYMLVLTYILLDQWEIEKCYIFFVTFLKLCDPAPALIIFSRRTRLTRGGGRGFKLSHDTHNFCFDHNLHISHCCGNQRLFLAVIVVVSCRFLTGNPLATENPTAICSKVQ